MQGKEESDIYSEETVDTIIEVLRILYNIAIRERPGLLKGANDNEKKIEMFAIQSSSLFLIMMLCIGCVIRYGFCRRQMNFTSRPIWKKAYAILEAKNFKGIICLK